MEQSRSGRSVAAASAPIEKPDVFEARIAVGLASRSSSRKTRIFRSSRSGTHSTIRSATAAIASESLQVSRASAAFIASGVSLPRATAPSSPKRPETTSTFARSRAAGATSQQTVS